MTILLSILFIIASYLLGSVPNGLIIAKILGKQDPRKSGSGNIGATNVARTGGTFAGIVVLILDILKGYFPVYFTMRYGIHEQLPLFAGLAAFMGHTFPVYLKFKGGKGVATSIGVFTALVPIAVLTDAIIFFIIFFIWKFVSLSSIISAICLPGIIKLLQIFGIYGSYNDSIVFLATTVSFIIVYKHRENISRLLKKQELKFGNKHKINK
jgi:glycerol-3-phosphate acyltransferase PlsY